MVCQKVSGRVGHSLADRGPSHFHGGGGGGGGGGLDILHTFQPSFPDDLTEPSNLTQMT